MTPEREAAGVPAPARSLYNELPGMNGGTDRSRAPRSVPLHVVSAPAGWTVKSSADYNSRERPIIALGLRPDEHGQPCRYEAMIAEGCAVVFASEVLGTCTVSGPLALHGAARG